MLVRWMRETRSVHSRGLKKQLAMARESVRRYRRDRVRRRIRKLRAGGSFLDSGLHHQSHKFRGRRLVGALHC
jgi:hypothetical protein